MRWRILGLILLFFLSCAEAHGEWQIYKSADGAFQIQFPAAPVQKKEFTTDTPAGKVTSQTVYVSESLTGKTLYTVTASVYPNNLEENSKAVLDGVSQGLKISDRVIDERDVSLQGHPGRRIRYKQHPDWSGVEMRVFLVENCLYVLTADSGNKEEDVNIFFDSFQILR